MNDVETPSSVEDAFPSQPVSLAESMLENRSALDVLVNQSNSALQRDLDSLNGFLDTLVTGVPKVVGELPPDITQVDAANALLAFNSPYLKFNTETEKWLIFDDERGWNWDLRNFRMNRLTLEALEKLENYVPKELDTTQSRRFAKSRRTRARGLKSVNGLKGIATLASIDDSVHCPSSEIDADPEVIGTSDGVLQLRSGQKAAHSCERYLTRRVTVKFDPAATSDRWENFLREILGDEDEIQDYFQQLVGYLLTGETSQQQMWLLVGNGSNGKSTLLKILQKMMGQDYAQQAPESVLLGRPNTSGASSDLVRLKGIRCAILPETNHGQSFNEERVKALVAADTIAARGLFQDFEEFIPQAKFLLATNHLPVVRGTDKGIWRRLVVIPFTREFEVVPNSTLFDELVAELPGIFAWAVRGSMRWYDPAVNFTVPVAWALATSQYRREQDPLKAYFDERVVTGPELFVGATELFENYVEWAKEDGRPVLSQAEFGTRVTDTGLATRARKFKSNRHHYIGIALGHRDAADVAA